MTSTLDLLVRGRRILRSKSRIRPEPLKDDAVCINRDLLEAILNKLDGYLKIDTTTANVVKPLLSENEQELISHRGTGRTTRQMIDAPTMSFFICNGPTDYYDTLARKHERTDLQLRTMGWAEHRTWRGTDPQIIVDHSAAEKMTGTLLRDIEVHNTRRRPL